MDGEIVPSPHGDKAQDGQTRNAPKNAAKRPKRKKGEKQDVPACDARASQSAKKPKSKAKPGRRKGAAKGKYRGKKSPKERGWLGKTAYAALDLGTNNCRLLIAREARGGFTVIDAFSRVVRLGEGLASNGRMSEAAMDRAVEALAICSEKLKRRNVSIARSVATEACRQADNGLEFIDRVASETGILLDVIEPYEEARLAVMGCYALLEEGEGPALIFDIGGGSTELVLVDTDEAAPKILDWVSIPWGVVSLTESVQADQSSRDTRLESYAKMRGMVTGSFSEFAARLPADAGTYRFMGTSGTVTTLSSVYLDLPSYNRNAIDGLYVPAQDMRVLAQEIAACSVEERSQYPTIGLDRAELVVAGCAIMEAIFDIWPGERLGVADRGIREGILRALIASDQQKRRGFNGQS